ncbi:hypothetical protein E3N88_31098 [Mikania micrantha]|uniref:Uncharacterized protein n=1 Tax=Mikania micrantha TaxID=192012 RepID=A0A5N6LCP0_9ASTR|nr:hypothetical protein E3N88_44215 [Mikania micrantha]KAD3641874.1 hypothetical protein E3N88_31098 [Mikania micrantha]
MMTRQSHQDQQSRVFYELSALILNLIRYPPTSVQFSDERPPRPAPLSQITPAGFASMLLGISLALIKQLIMEHIECLFLSREEKVNGMKPELLQNTTNNFADKDWAMKLGCRLADKETGYA